MNASSYSEILRTGIRPFVTNICLGLILFSNLGIGASNQVQVQAGSIYAMNVQVNQSAAHWAIFYGIADANGNPTQTSLIEDSRIDLSVVSTRVYPSSAYYSPSCLTTTDWLFASDQDAIHWDNLAVAQLSDLNALAGIADNSLEDAAHLFSQNGNLTLGAYQYWNTANTSTNINDKTVSKEYVLKDVLTGKLVFAVPLVYPAVNGYDNTPVNFQILLVRGPRYHYFFNPQLCIPTQPIISNPSGVTPPIAAKQPPANINPVPKTEGPPTNIPISPISGSEKIKSNADEVFIPPGKTLQVQITQNPQTQVVAKITTHQTVIDVLFTFTTAGLNTVVVQFPFAATELTQGKVTVQLIKMKDSGHAIQALDQRVLGFDTEPFYQLEDLKNATRVVWVIDTNQGDVYDARALIGKALANETIKKISVQTIPGNATGQLFPTPVQKSTLAVQVIQTQNHSAYGIISVLVVLALGMAALFWKKPWIAHYLSAGKRGYLIHFFFLSKSKSKP